jgi:hypothetical protein
MSVHGQALQPWHRNAFHARPILLSFEQILPQASTQPPSMMADPLLTPRYRLAGDCRIKL